MKNLVLCLVVLVAGCRVVSVSVVSRTDIGKVIKVTVIRGGWSQEEGTQIETEKSVIVIYGHPIVPIGEIMTLIEMSDGLKYVTWKSHKRMYSVMK